MARKKTQQRQLPQPRRDRLADALEVVLGYRPSLPLLHAQHEFLRTGDASKLGDARSDHAVTDPDEAWQALAARGVIPLDWIDAPQRRFHALDEVEHATVPRTYSGTVTMFFDDEGRMERIVEKRDRYLPHPPTLALCVALAADVPGVAAAEHVARALLRCEESSRALWRYGTARRGGTHRAHGYAFTRVSDGAIWMTCPEIGA